MEKDNIFWLLYDSNKNEDLNNESSKFNDNDQISSKDEEDEVEEDCEDDVESFYYIYDMNELDESNTDNSTTEESTDKVANSYEAKNFRWSKVPPRVGRARRENIILCLPGCQSQAKNANTPFDVFSLFISKNMLKIILYHTNQKIQKYLMNFNGSFQRRVHDITLDEIGAVIGLLIYGGVFES